jgi:hypothetical protein
MKPQIESRAETTRAAHDTFIGTHHDVVARARAAQMLTATNDRRAYIRRRSVEVAVHDGALLTSHLFKYVSQVAYARLVVARCH